ncbi:hypothetical protein GcC1_207010 [Golovinomyces cichoracearum]|uniref:2EXR domain-containing protein n=1 Tax=Golovinomyces cichoracearum TaxID=62708 RepID=A0A420HBY5_9PEZI|nr:hypothetical protein GcC1_207010 [Golovinomyces cichoracearum]
MSTTLTLQSRASTTTSFSAPIVNLVFTKGQIQQHKQLDSFHLFSRLPIELRLSIYTLALPRRILTVRYNASSHKFTSPTAAPALFSVCSESRQVAVKNYTLSFGTTTSNPKIYFNPELDTLYLPRCSEMGYDEDFRIMRSLNVESQEQGEPKSISATQNIRGTPSISKLPKFDQLRSVAIDHVDPEIKRPWERFNKASFLRGFPLLNEIILVLPSDEEAPPSTPATSAIKPIHSETDSLWCDPQLPPETIVQIWWCFRKSFATEENILKEVCDDLGTEYKGISLPTVRVKVMRS